MQQKLYERQLGFSRLSVQVVRLGDDYQLTLWGGERPHVGCTVLAIPRPSLTGNGQSATASVLNVTGHKDEVICRHLAEQVARRSGAVVVCTGGFHMDNATPEQIHAVLGAAEELAEEVIQ